jgi:hypothetical protein
VEIGTIGLSSASRVRELLSPTFDYLNGRQSSGFSRGSGLSMQGQPSGQDPDTDHLLVIHPQRRAVERILTERPQFLRKSPFVDLDESHAWISLSHCQDQVA